nr:immunoglobulin heavy chain junction region [Mus musculus]MBK4184113.1 immunoglobulin heavy chain junction region [Mus musculus]
CTRRPFDYW